MAQRKKNNKQTQRTKTQIKTGPNVADIFFAGLFVLAFLSLFVIGGYIYFLKNAPQTVGTAYTDVLTYTADKPFIAEIKYFSNQAKNGKECLDFRMNYYTDTTIPKTEDEYKNVYSAGIQLVDSISWHDTRDTNYYNKTVYFCEPDNPIYYNSTNGTSYEAIKQLEPSDSWIVDFSGELGRIVQTEPVHTQQILWWQSFYRFDINALVRDIYNSIQTLNAGKHILQFDFSKYFEVRKYNVEKGQFEQDSTTDDKFVFVNVLIEKSNNGIIEAEQSLFGIVNKNVSWSFSGTHNQDYWNATSSYLLTLADFEVVVIDSKQYLKLRDSAVRYLYEFSDVVINVVLDLDNNYLLENNINVYGFAQNCWGNLNINSVSITSSNSKTLVCLCDMPPTYAPNITFVQGGDN